MGFLLGVIFSMIVLGIGVGIGTKRKDDDRNDTDNNIPKEDDNKNNDSEYDVSNVKELFIGYQDKPELAIIALQVLRMARGNSNTERDAIDYAIESIHFRKIATEALKGLSLNADILDKLVAEN